MPYGTLLTDTIKSSTSGPVAFQNTSGTEVGTLCRAWVNFNGTGTVAIRASFNVSSITDNGTGNYTVNFTNAMPDANYVAIGTNNGMPGGSSNTAGIYGTNNSGTGVNMTTTACQVYTGNDSSVAIDSGYICFAFFR